MTASTIELLNAGDHAELRLGPPSGPPPHFVQIVLDELAGAASICPIFLTKSPETGAFYVGAMLGFKADEAVLVDTAERSGTFDPLDWARRGFYVSGEQIAIDAGDPRFADPAGEPMFERDGRPAPALVNMTRTLGRLKAGMDATQAFVDAMLAHKLVEAIDVSLDFDDGERLNLAGLYTISLDSLGELDDAAALALFRAGHLQAAYIMSQSLRQVARLARRRNERLAAG
ncbi:SapC family protein [Sphingomonas sp.]|uniref:SapC family protein n=1 Tax=Sphingomonas sp. TaxID=28214 RepID=UPI002C07DFE9|nr:SapC family protein [Sphingomonas sp.]HTG38157.1 SapC family protein [Sphingomonas sp.]